MKTNLLKNWGLACLSLFAVAACSEEEFENEIPMEIEVTADIEAPTLITSAVENVEEQGETRTYMHEDGTGTLWRARESIGVYSSLSKNVKMTSTNTSNASTVKFTGLILGSPRYAYYPYSKENEGVSYTRVKGNIPQVQEYNQARRDLAADYRAGVLETRTWFTNTFTFKRLVSFIKFSIDATGTEVEGETLKSVQILLNNNRHLSGDFTINLQSQETTPATFVEGNNGVTLKTTDYPTLASGKTYVGYVCTLPAMQAGDEMTLVITTDKHVVTVVRTSKVTQSANGITNMPLTLSKLTDRVVTEIPQEEAPEEVEAPQLVSMKFTVADNPGKILPRKFTVDSKATVKTSNISEVVCTIDKENKKITMNVPYLNDRNLVPTFEVPEGARFILEKGDEITSGETVVDFLANKQIGVERKGAITVYDVEFTNSGLPVVVVNQWSGVGHSEANSKYKTASDTWYKATGTEWQPKDADWSMEEGDNFMVYYPDGSPAISDKKDNTVTEPILSSTRLRGNVTQQMPKKSFAVKLDSKTGIFMNDNDATNDLPAHKRWCLLANWKDRTMMRNEVAFGIAKVFKQTFPNDGLAWNPQGQYVELVYNGVHVGTYYLCEQIKIDGNRLDINDPYDKDEAYSGVAEDYGYLMECDDGYDETWKFTTACYIPFLFKDDGNQEMVDYAAGVVRGVEDKLYAGKYSEAYETLELTSVVDYWLIQEIMMNSEMKHPKSAYMYLNKGKLYAGPIWDFDWNTLPVKASNSEEGYSYTKSMIEVTKTGSSSFFSRSGLFHKKSGYPNEPYNENDDNYMWYPMLVKDTQFKEMAAERWNTVKGAVLAYVSTLNKVAENIKVSEKLNYEMWSVHTSSGWGTSTYGIGGGICGDEGYDFDKAVTTLQTTLNTRINGMDYVSNKSWPSKTYKEE